MRCDVALALERGELQSRLASDERALEFVRGVSAPMNLSKVLVDVKFSFVFLFEMIDYPVRRSPSDCCDVFDVLSTAQR